MVAGSLEPGTPGTLPSALFPVHSGKAMGSQTHLAHTPHPWTPSPLSSPLPPGLAPQGSAVLYLDTPCPGTDLASSLTSCCPGLDAPSQQGLMPAALRCHHPSPVSFFLHHHHLPIGRTTSSFLVGLSPPLPSPTEPQLLESWTLAQWTPSSWTLSGTQ